MKITAHLDNTNGPTEMVWSNDSDEVGAILCLTQIMQHAKNDDPWAPAITGVTIEF